MCSTSVVEARPVRSPPSSCLSEASAPCMRRLRSFMSKESAAMASSAISLLSALPVEPHPVGQALADGGEMAFPAQHGLDCPPRADREHDDRHTVFPGKRER